jgi:ligand-binding sensor domain-containing protein/signal transduction histidine kinase
MRLGAAAPMAAAPGGPDPAWFARVWQSEEGLPQNNVTGVAQGADGYLWVSTHNGLVRFDGVRFERIPLALPGGRTQPLIRAMLLGRGGQLWLVLEGGVAACLALGQTNVFSSVKGLSTFRPLSLAQDSDRAIWIGYSDGSACRIAAGSVTRFTGRDGLPGTGACWLATDLNGQVWFSKAGRVGVFRDGRFVTLLTLPERSVRLAPCRAGGLWVCAGRQLYLYDGSDRPRKLGELGEPTDGAEIEPSVLFEARAGTLWVGTSGSGLFRYDGTNSVRVWTSHGAIESLADDREGNVWVGTGGGGLDRLRQRVLELHGGRPGLPFEAVRSVCADDSGRVWATTEHGALLRELGQDWQALTREDGWPGARATCVANDGRGAVWIGTSRGGLYRWAEGGISVLTRSNGLAGETVRALLPDRAGNLWIGLESTTCLQRYRAGELQTYPQPPGSRMIRTMAEDAAGRVWLGTSDGFLLEVTGDRLTDRTPAAMVRRKPIRCLYATPDGSLWIGFSNAGLGRLRNAHFSLIGSREGLRDDYVCAMASDENGGLWFAGDHGVFQVRQRELEAVMEGRAAQVLSVVYGRDEALPSLQASYGHGPNSARSRDGRIFFPMRTGLAVVHPDRVQPNRIPPPVLIQRLWLDGQEVLWPAGDQSLRLAPGHRRLDIDYTAVSFIAPENVRFRYRLRGWEDDWFEAGPKRTASYTRLPAGTYEFQVAACNSTGVWNQPGAIASFVVAPFYWQTWWFRAALATLVMGGLFLAIRSYERRKLRLRLAFLEREHAVERERTRIARDIHDELGADLTQIGLLADLGSTQVADAPQTESNFSKIGARAREAVSALEEIVWAANPRNDNLPRLADYLCHLADEIFESGPARCRKEVPTGLPPVPIRAEVRHHLALAVKEALANALKHSGAQTVWLRLNWADPDLTVSVDDDGRGLKRGEDGALADGLRNQAARMEEIGGRVEIGSRPKQGTQVRFAVRLAPQ